ncbi:MAG: FAD binding domain-containing protein, partial [Acidobacteriota bacterium]
ASFDYYRAKNVKEAVSLLRKKRDAKILAGGHSLLPAMKLRVSSPAALIDIGGIKGLAEIKTTKSSLKIGALTTYASIAASKDVKKLCPILAEAAAQIGDLQVRNRGTIGGSLVHADPAADLPSVILALEAKLTATGSKGRRKIPAERFFVDFFTTALKSSEVLTEVAVPVLKAGMGGVYLKHRHPASSYAVVGVAAVVALKNGVCSAARLVVGGAMPTPVVLTGTSEVLVGQKPTTQVIGEAASRVAEAITFPLSDVYASGEYRTHLATVMARRALAEAVKRARRKR